MWKSLQTIGCFLLFLFILPQCFWIVVFIAYLRKFTSLYLAYKYGTKFKGLLRGMDVIFALGDGKAKRIVNVMGYIHVDKALYEPNRTATKIMVNLRRKFKDILHNDDIGKLFYKLKCEFGYFYWIQGEIGPVESYVDYMNFDIAEKFITVDDVKKFMGRISNDELPEGSNLEFLLANKPIECGNVVKFPVMFRLHHAVGDGSAILKIFLNIIADDSSMVANGVKPNGSKFRAICSRVVGYCKEIITSITHTITLTYTVPYQLGNLLFLKSIDKNSMHPKVLQGENVINWIHEKDVGFPVLETLKKIKKHFPGTKFNEIIATALSRGIESYFANKPEDAPAKVSVVVAQQMVPTGNKNSDKFQVHNKFGIFYLTLPIEKPKMITNHSKVSRFFTLLLKIKQNYESDQKDLLASEYILNKLAEHLPWPMLRSLKFDHCTCSLGILAGPEKKIKINGHEIHDITFWQPTVDRIAVGVSLFSYDNKIQLGIMADKAAIGSEVDAGLILKGMVREIKDVKEALDI